ncbi:hypothetical protein U9M48_004470, partial [Paspalum notatum var. saurae]
YKRSLWIDTSIVLIPKVQHPERLKECRPISLCNVTYKIVSKRIVNRLRPLLDGLIFENQNAFPQKKNQNAFVPGRLITDNALIAFECIHAIQEDGSNRSEYCAYKLDLAKAYDRVDWGYLEQVLVNLGFHRNWVQWVMACVTTVHYSVRFNGVLLDTIQPTRGLRQGDPLSPILQRESSNGRIQGLRVSGRAPEITHLLFADDSLLFFRATAEQATRVKEGLLLYGKATGQMINFDKCSIMFNAKQDEASMLAVKSLLNVHSVAFEAKYLGLPTPEGRMKADKFQGITERLIKRCNAWDESKIRSRSPRTTCVYSMSVFLLPASLCETWTRRIRQYWWGELGGRRKTQWIAWDKFTTPKGQCGLGFRDLRLFNQALSGRQAWRLIESPESLCACVLKAKYFPNGNLLYTSFPLNQSPTWRAVVHGLELLKKGFIWRIGSGERTRMWRDPWIPGGWSLRAS